MDKQWLRRSVFVLLAGVLGFHLTPAARSANSVAPTGGILPAADTYVDSASPSSNYGKGKILQSKSSSPIETDLVRFVVPSMGPGSKAVLFLYSSTSSSSGLGVETTTNSWDEMKVTYSTAPPTGPVQATSGPVYKNQWAAIDVTSMLSGSGTYSFAVVDPSSSQVNVSSREGMKPPRLVVSAAASPSPSPSSSPAPSSSPTPTSSPTPSPATDPSPATSSTPSPTATATPTPSSGSLITDPSLIFAVPTVGKPDYLSPFTDPTFGTQVTRIAGDANTSISFSSGGSGTWGSDARQHYNDDQPWNADGSLLWLQNSGSPSVVILDGNTYQPKLKPCSNYSSYDDRWHPTLPHVRISRNGTTLQWFDVVTCTQLRAWTLPIAATMDSEAGPSRDGRFWALGDSTRVYVVQMDPMPGKIGPAFDMYTNCGLSDCTVDHVSISPSGQYVLVHYSGDHIRILDVNPTTLALTPHAYPSGTPECSGHDPSKGFVFDVGHGDLTFDPWGDDVVVAQNRSWCPQTVNGVALGQVYSVRLKDGYVRSLLQPGTAQSYHVSCRNYLRPGWCYASFWPGAGKPYNDEIIAVALDGSGRVERLVHTHTDTNGCYRCEAHPVPSPDGLRVIFASSWSVNCGSVCGTQSNPQAYIADSRFLR